jgi:hypothetical protein
VKEITKIINGKPVKFLHTEPGEKTEKRKPDIGEKFTEKKLTDLDTKLRNVYQAAASDLYAKQTSWLYAHEKRVEKYRAQLEAGLITKEDYDAWMRGQMFQKQAWALKRGQLARTMAEADKRALEMINEGKLEVFAENANYMGFLIDEQTGGAAASFGLYNEAAVRRMVKDEPNLLPMPEIDEEKDYQWYNKIINNAVTQGIIQGESLSDICLRIAEESGERGLNALRRNARTAYTGAQNAGRMEAARQARDEMGIRVRKRWECTLDDKTRDAHAEMDGQIRELDEPFESMLGEIMFPGDPNAEPANVYNCRCRMEQIAGSHIWKMDRRDGMTGEIVGDVTYREWVKGKDFKK